MLIVDCGAFQTQCALMIIDPVWLGTRMKLWATAAFVKRTGRYLCTNVTLKFFLQQIHWKCAAMDFLGQLEKRMKGNRYFRNSIDMYSKLARVVYTVRIATTNVACKYLHFWIVSYEILSYIITDNSTSVSSKRVATLCMHLQKNERIMLTYHLRSPFNAFSFNFCSKLRLYALGTLVSVHLAIFATGHRSSSSKATEDTDNFPALKNVIVND